jgi:hypothetical protein
MDHELTLEDASPILCHLTPAILFRAADLLTANYGAVGMLYMCIAVTNAASDLGADVAGAMIEFKALLAHHGVSRGGDLTHTTLDGDVVHFFGAHIDEDLFWPVAQPVRFMFLEFLALSLEA